MSELPDGFRYVPDFLGESEESDLLQAISTVNFREFAMKGVTAKRRIAQFGWHYSFDSFRLTPAEPPPPPLDSIRIRVGSIAAIPPEAFSEVLITEYRPDAGIGWHRDAPPFGIV